MIKINYFETPVQDVVALMRQTFPGVPLTKIRGIAQQSHGSWISIASGCQFLDSPACIQDALRRLHEERPYLLIVNQTREVDFFPDLFRRFPSLGGTHQTVIYHPLSEENGDFACLLSA